jgi:hypothetical protein
MNIFIDCQLRSAGSIYHLVHWAIVTLSSDYVLVNFLTTHQRQRSTKLAYGCSTLKWYSDSSRVFPKGSGSRLRALCVSDPQGAVGDMERLSQMGLSGLHLAAPF